MTLRVRVPQTANANGDWPKVACIDLIRGDMTGLAGDRSRDRNPTARVEARFTAANWTRDGTRW